MTKLGKAPITIRRRHTVRVAAMGAIAAGVVTLALASPAAARSRTPVTARLTGTVTPAPLCPVSALCFTATDQGTATELGKVTLTKQFTVQLTNTTCANGGRYTTYQETATLATANDSTLRLQGEGSACVANGHAIAHGHLNVTGGTGRFDDATGALTENVDHNLATNVETETMTGSLSLKR